MKYTVLVKYGEIGLKGKNQDFFKKKLNKNIAASAKITNTNLIDVIKQRDRTLCIFDDEKEKIIETLNNVMGIKFFCFVDVLEKDVDKIVVNAKKIALKLKEDKYNQISLVTKRSDKRFPLKSPELNSEIGEMITEIGMKVNYREPEVTIYTEIGDKDVFMYSQRYECAGGLPVGTSGKVLQLLSGGIDSPVSAYMMMRRGCVVDFIHFHTEPTNEAAFNLKVKDLAESLNKYQFKCKIYMVPYSTYEFLTSGKIPERYELVFFKHYILKVAERVAKFSFSNGIVTGDNLAQVASQTLDNLKAVNLTIDMPIYRPLLTYDKEDIIDVARKIGTFDLSTQSYKDCCSIAAKNPLTKAKVEKFEEILEVFDIDNLIEETIKTIESYDIKPDSISSEESSDEEE